MKKHLLMTLILLPATAMAAPVDELLQQYQQQGASAPSAAAGKQLWEQPFTDPKSGKTRQCSTCHGSDLSQKGKHVRTGKTIDPLAVSANPQSLTDKKKIKKWLKRNCKWTIGRECTPQEKANVLTFISQQ